MITVTKDAKEKLKETIEKHTKEPGVAVRIESVSSSQNRLELLFDKEKEGDYVVKDDEGTKLVFVSPDSVSAVKGAVIGYQKNFGFIIEKLGSDIS